MAKQYLKIFKDYLLKAYSSGNYPLTSIAIRNQTFRLMPIQTEETANTQPQFNIQIFKRLKAKDSIETTSADGSGQATNTIARMDKAQKIVWETIETKWAKKRELLIVFKEGTHLDYSLNSQESRALNDSVTARMMEHEEKFLEEVVGDLNDNEVKIIKKLDKENVIDPVSLEIKRQKLLVGPYVAYSKDIAIFYHPSISDVYSDHQGVDFQTGTNTFPKGFQDGFMYKGDEYYEALHLNSISKDQTDDQSNKHTYVPAVIVVAKQFLYDAGMEVGFKKLHQAFMDYLYDGHSYSDLFGLINRDRVGVFKISKDVLKLDVSKKVND